MTQVTWEVVGGKVVFDGRTLTDWVPVAVDALVERFDPVQIVLFGSVARGDDGPDSDIDLLVVLPRLNGRRHDVAVEMLRTLRDVPAPIDVFPTDAKDIERRGALPGLLRVALREGRVVHQRAA